MSKIISIHEYTLRPGVDSKQFERAIQEAQQRGLLKLPGLIGHHFVKGVRGVRSVCYAAYGSTRAERPGKSFGDR